MIDNHWNDNRQLSPQFLILEHVHPFLDLIIQGLKPGESIWSALVLKKELHIQILVSTQKGQGSYYV